MAQIKPRKFTSCPAQVGGHSKVEIQRAYYDTLFGTSKWRLAAAFVMVGDDEISPRLMCSFDAQDVVSMYIFCTFGLGKVRMDGGDTL